MNTLCYFILSKPVKLKGTISKLKLKTRKTKYAGARINSSQKINFTRLCWLDQ